MGLAQLLGGHADESVVHIHEPGHVTLLTVTGRGMTSASA
jgi:hypothetical protein